MIQDIQEFKVDVLSLHRDPDTGEKCSFAAATLPSPPKIADLPMEESKIQDNQFESLSRLTTYIRELNRNNINSLILVI